MKLQKNVGILFILLLFWTLLLVFLTPIILLFFNENVIRSNIAVDMNGEQVNYAIDNWSYYDNIIPMITIDGWAFVETENDNLNKTVKLIFVSEKITYEVNTDLHSRQGLVKVFKDKNVPKERTGYSTKFSPIGMKNGDYTLYFYVFENDDDFGIVNTGREFRKSYRTFTELKGGEKVENGEFSKTVANNLINYYIDWCVIKGGKLDVYGWAFLENSESSEKRVFLEIQKPDGTLSYYSTKRIFRKGVGEYFNNDRYDYSGFQALIPLSALGTGNNLISVIIDKQNRAVYEYSFYWDGKETN